jgi:hypothetical protein
MPEDYTSKRRDLATKAIDAATMIVNGTRLLVSMGPELAQAGGGFSDDDFNGTAMSHVNAYKMDILINVVAPALQRAADQTIAPDSSIKHVDILLAVKRA